MNTTIKNAIDTLNKRADRSAWNKGVTNFAIDLLTELDDAIRGGWFEAENLNSRVLVEKAFLNGAGSWGQYAWSGCGLVYNYDIATALCAPWELRKTDHGNKAPNAREQWLDVYARAMYQASRRALNALK